ncbi:transposase family protein [Desertibacillus haloalkaliphilus]|uniref:transposase family protein n=1 Tax=Desertibacillus haloalkaliphilus TaxID=1328930 RepID=UPI0028A9BA04|nr:transposase family protein [Desertibacillus haloalkaliphilus]
MSCSHSFFEKFSFVDRYQRHTVMLAQEGLSLSAEMSFTHAGQLIGVSVNRLLCMFDQRNVPVSKVLPRAIVIDEFKGDADKEKFQTIIVDVEKRKSLMYYQIAAQKQLRTTSNSAIQGT